MHFQWPAALKAALIAGIILRVVPRASPWEGMTFFTPVIMGRAVPNVWTMPYSFSLVLHFAISFLYGIVISLLVMRLRAIWAVTAGAVVGLLFYGINVLVVRTWFPEMAGNEIAVAVTHLVFGLISAGAYRGLLRRGVPVISAEEPPAGSIR